jgi:hypothetical protein
MLTRLPAPPAQAHGLTRYTLRPRPKRSFNTVLDAKTLLDDENDRRTEVSLTRSDAKLELALVHPLREGRIEELFECDVERDELVASAFTRSLYDRTGKRVRHEEVLFDGGHLGLPPTTYPEVTVPFLLGAIPHDGKLRSVHAWINDRFVARVYIESQGEKTIEVRGKKVRAIEAIMYPDINDWVNLGAMLTKLAKPLLPKYRMWFDTAPGRKLIRFEGPYGPPGAPEIILEVDD